MLAPRPYQSEPTEWNGRERIKITNTLGPDRTTIRGTKGGSHFRAGIVNPVFQRADKVANKSRN
jgi:hypothetical protein